MTSPCFRHSYGFDLETVKSPSTSNNSSPSESSNSLSTRRPRTPRKRPNQTYNEAAALLSTAYPNIFSPKTLSHPSKFTRAHQFADEPSPELLWPLRAFDQDSGCLPHHKPNCLNEVKVSNFMSYNHNSNWVGNWSELEDFDAESILDEETEVGIDSIMGNLSVGDENSGDVMSKEGKFEGFGDGVVGKGVRAFRRGNDWNWWCFPVVDMRQISPRLCKAPDSTVKPKLKKLNSGDRKKTKPAAISKNSAGLMLKLDYDGVLDAWSDRRSPYFDDASVGFLCPNHRDCA